MSMNSKRKQSKTRTIERRDGPFCHYCGCKPLPEDKTLDHRIPKSQGGSDKNENLVLACRACNQAKSDRYPFTKSCR